MGLAIRQVQRNVFMLLNNSSQAFWRKPLGLILTIWHLPDVLDINSYCTSGHHLVGKASMNQYKVPLCMILNMFQIILLEMPTYLLHPGRISPFTVTFWPGVMFSLVQTIP